MNDHNPYAAPEFSASSRGKFSGRSFDDPNAADCWRDGDVLVLRKEAILPDRCVKCNLPADSYRLKRNLSWHPPVWYLTALISPLLYVIVALVVRHTARIEVGLCEHHRLRRARAIASAWIVVAVGVNLMVIGAFWVDPQWLPYPFLIGSVIILAGIIIGVVGSQVVSTKSIDEHHVWLAKVDPEYLRMLPAWLE